jgi:hypothetical protein
MSPSSLADVPPEILDNTFGHLSKGNLVRCQLACSKWRRVVQEQLYKNAIGFSSTVILDSFLEALTSSPTNPGVHVKCLDLYPLPYIKVKMVAAKNLNLQGNQQLVNVVQSWHKIITIFGKN